jgi:calcineurin-like phosphoesterase family protein
MITIAVLRETELVTDADVQGLISALQVQVHDHFAPAWGIDAIVQFVRGGPPSRTSWLVILDDSDQAEALGYHDVTDEGLPLGKVFVRTSREVGVNWTVTASHELLEMLADPEINLSVLVNEDTRQASRLYAYEVCDPCEADQFGYRIGDVVVSDFVFPAWFQAFRKPGSGSFDYCGQINVAFALLPGGYASVLNITTQGDWTQIQASSPLQIQTTRGLETYRGRPAVAGSRRERRSRRRREAWNRSTLPPHRVATPEARARLRPVIHPAGFILKPGPQGARVPHIVTSTAKELSVIGEIRRAIDAVAARPAGSLPNAGAVQNLLETALNQAQRRDRNADLRGAMPDDLHLSVVLSAINGTGGHPHPVKTMDLIGIKQYEELDPGWVGSLYNRLNSERVPFPTHVDLKVDPLIRIGNQVRIAMAGDWGTGNASSKNIAQRISDLKPDHTIHLGDVYYSGTEEEEQSNFLGRGSDGLRWPAGTSPNAPSCALNGNHEMYSGGAGYFVDALGGPQFSAQQGLSYFALTNDYWTIIGLDSAYYSHQFLYQTGNIDGAERDWARETARAARSVGKGVILLTHHHGIDFDPDSNKSVLQQPFWDDVVLLFDGGPDYWYWGHVHAGIAFAPLDTRTGMAVRARCVGHGGIPYKPFPKNADGDATAKVLWAEDCNAGDNGEPRRALNGFVLLTLDSKNLREEFFGEDGSVRKSL